MGLVPRTPENPSWMLKAGKPSQGAGSKLAACLPYGIRHEDLILTHRHSFAVASKLNNLPLSSISHQAWTCLASASSSWISPCLFLLGNEVLCY